jgi:hypothetical protein
MTNRTIPTLIDRLPRASRGLALGAALVVAGATACSDEVDPVQPPSPQFNPNPADFGRVSVVEERTLGVVVSNTGGSPYRITADLPLEGDDATLFSVGALPEVLTTEPGLPIGQTATITFTFRPCPAAIQDPANIGTCPLRSRTARLPLVDNSEDGSNEITLTGVATLPPNLSVRCGRACGDFDELGQCTTLLFNLSQTGGVPVGESCALPVEITNEDIGEDPVADIEIENLGIRVQEFAEGVAGAVVAGADAGLRIRELNADGTLGDDLAPSFANPLVVSIPRGQTEFSYKFAVEFSPAANISYQGQPVFGNGFRINYNDPVEPELLLTVLATGIGPRFEVVNIDPAGNFPFESGQTIQFRGVVSGETATRRIRFENTGTDEMTLGPLVLEAMDPEYSIAYVGSNDAVTDEVTLFELGAGETSRTLEITYAPTDDEPDTDAILVTCSTPSCDPSFVVNLAGGALPKLELSPPTAFFQSSGGQQQCTEVTLSNVEGDAELVIDRFALTGDNPESLDDFFVDLPECGSGVTDCTVEIRIAAGAQDAVDVCYRNGDSSQRDSANLEVRSNDPSAPGGIRTIALIAEDNPCFPPEVDAVEFDPTLTVGEVEILNFNPVAERAGGLGGAGGVLTECSIRQLTGEPLNLTPNPVTAADSWEVQMQAASLGPRVLGIECTNNCGATGAGQVFLLFSP